MKIEERKIAYKKAIEKWGEQSQLEMAQEEATELALAIRKYIRNNNDLSFSNLVEEIADVEIMIEQIKMMHEDYGFEMMVDSQKVFKLNRLINKLDKN